MPRGHKQRGKRLGSLGSSLVKIAVNNLGAHPEIIERTDAIALSANARLGAMLAHCGITDPGQDFTPLGNAWLDDLFDIASEAADRFEEEDDDLGSGGDDFPSLEGF